MLQFLGRMFILCTCSLLIAPIFADNAVPIQSLSLSDASNIASNNETSSVTNNKDKQSAMSINSNAVEFASQAGQIAGVAQACGQDVSSFMTRVGEAIDKLATNAADRVTAMMSFQQFLQQSENLERTKQVVPCTKAIQDYKNLPILRDDYKKTVLMPLSNMKNTPPGSNSSNVPTSR